MKTISRAQYRKLKRLDLMSKRLHERMERILTEAIELTGDEARMGYTSDWIYGAIGLDQALRGNGITVEPDKRQRAKDAIFRG